MAYNKDVKSTDLDALTTMASGDLFIVGDLDDGGRAKKITKANLNNDFDSSTTAKGFVKLSTAPVSATEPIAVGDNDTRVPSQDENNALAGTSGTPSSSNKYVTNDDTGETGASKVVRTNGTGLLDLSIMSNLFSVGSTTYNASTASGTQNIAHGLGITPKRVAISAVYSINNYMARAYTIYNGTTQASNYTSIDAGGIDVEYVGDSFKLLEDNNYSQTGVITTDATNIIITWTKAGSPTGTIYLLWEAQY